MKPIITLIAFFLIFSISTYAQQHSDLYLKVDSLMRHDLKFNVDSAIAALEKQDSAGNSLTVKDGNNPPPFPPVLMNGKIIELTQLDRYKLNQVKKIKVIQHPSSIALFASRGVFGLIFITMK